MGYAIAETLAKKGAYVYLVTGPTSLTMENRNVEVIPIKKAKEMYDACHQYFPACTGAFLAAAVSDYKPAAVSPKKIKKGGNDELNLKLTPNPDILHSLGEIKKPNQVIVGFSLETENGEVNARQKLKSKDLDIIALNLANKEGTGFGEPYNQVTLFDRNGDKKEFDTKPKSEVASDLVEAMIRYLETSSIKD